MIDWVLQGCLAITDELENYLHRRKTCIKTWSLTVLPRSVQETFFRLLLLPVFICTAQSVHGFIIAIFGWQTVLNMSTR